MERGRLSLRLEGYDYSEEGAYFVTVVTHRRKDLFGRIQDDQVALSQVGHIAAWCWRQIPNHFPHVVLDQYVIMPNHVHGILSFNVAGATHASPLQGEGRTRPSPSGPRPGSLSAVMGSYKAAVSRLATASYLKANRLWQKGFYDHVVRSEEELARLRNYILNNPLTWDLDLREVGGQQATHASPLQDTRR